LTSLLDAEHVLRYASGGKRFPSKEFVQMLQQVSFGEQRRPNNKKCIPLQIPPDAQRNLLNEMLWHQMAYEIKQALRYEIIPERELTAVLSQTGRPLQEE